MNGLGNSSVSSTGSQHHVDDRDVDRVGAPLELGRGLQAGVGDDDPHANGMGRLHTGAPAQSVG